MRANVAIWKLVLLGAAMAAGGAGAADAKERGSHARGGEAAHARVSRVSTAEAGFKHARIGGHGRKEAYLDRGAEQVSYGGGGLQCVPFARENTGIELAGNAAAWWSAASGVYERGSRPEVGSILNFRSTGRMRSGHVAVVSDVENPRTVEIDHANWANHGGVSRNVTVVDVSPENDWSAVRVELGRGGEFGSVYPTYGFIYDRPDRGTLVANNATAPMPNALNPAPHDLRPGAERLTDDEPVEVAAAYTRVRYGYGRQRFAADGYHSRRYSGRTVASHSRRKHV